MLYRDNFFQSPVRNESELGVWDSDVVWAGFVKKFGISYWFSAKQEIFCLPPKQ